MTIATEAGHWYDKNGETRYTILGANGEERPTTLRDAKKFGWYPSVSGIMKCAAQGIKLREWDLKRHMQRAREAPHLTDKEILDAMQEESKEVMGLGSEIHGAIERWLKGMSIASYVRHAQNTAATLESWCGKGPYSTEHSFGHPLGFGGKVDVHKDGWVSDFKTKEFDESSLPGVWPNHFMQLAAYREGLGMPKARCSIIFVSTSVPGLTRLVEVAQSDLEKGWAMFKALLSYWQAEKCYQPNGASI